MKRYNHNTFLTAASRKYKPLAAALLLAGLTHMVPDPTVTTRMYGRIAGFFATHLRE